MPDAPKPTGPSWDQVAQAIQQTPQFKNLSSDKARMSFMTQAQTRYNTVHNIRVSGPAPAATGTPTPAEDNRDWYTRNIGSPMLKKTEEAIGGAFSLDPLSKIQGIEKNPEAYPITRGAARMVPVLGSETPGQAAIDTTMMGLWATGIGESEMVGKSLAKILPGGKVLGPLSRFATRASIPGVAGAAGSYAATGDPTLAAEAGVGGLTQGVGGEAVAGLGRPLARRLGRTLDDVSVRSIGDWVETYIPGAGKLKSITDFDKMFRPSDTNAAGEAVSGIVKHSEEQASKVERELAKHLPGDTQLTLNVPKDVRAHVDVPGTDVARPATPGRPAVPPHTSPGVAVPPTRIPKGQPGAGRVKTAGIPAGPPLVMPGRPAVPGKPAIPEGTYQMTFDEAKGLIDKVKSLGWTFKGDQANNATGRIMRQFARQAENELGMVVEQNARGFGTPWLSSRYRLDLSRTLTNMFSEPGVIKGGRIVDSELQKVAIATGNLGYRDDLISLLGGKRGMSFLKMIMHGADPGAATSIEGKFSPYLRMHPGMGMLSGHGGGLGFLGGSIGVHPQLPYRSGYAPLDMGRGALWAAYTLGPYGLARGIWTALGMDDTLHAPENNIIPTGHAREIEARR